MQLTFIVAAQPDTVAPHKPGRRESDAPWPALASSLQFAAIGALASMTLCALDYGRLALSSQRFQLTWAEHLAHLTLMFFAGYLAGLLGSVALHACVQLGRWSAMRWHVSSRLAISLVLATACLIIILPVAVTLFQGRGIRQTHIARWGPWVVATTGWVLCGVAAWAVQILHSSLVGRTGTLGVGRSRELPQQPCSLHCSTLTCTCSMGSTPTCMPC